MSFIHDVGQKLGRAAQAMGKRTEEAATVGKLNVEIGRLKAEIRQLTARLGEAAYDAYTQGADWNAACGPVCQEIQGKYQRIDEINAEVARLREEADRRAREKKEAAAAKRAEKAAGEAAPEEASTGECEGDFIPQQAEQEEETEHTE